MIMRKWLIAALCMCASSAFSQEPSGQRGVAGVRSESLTGAAGGRVALVIGNAAYRTGPLPNPANDAEAMAGALQKCGFTTILKTDADLEAMTGALDEFYEKTRRAEVALFFYAGHAVQVQGENYLLPVTADLKAEKDVQFRCMAAGLVLGRMEDAGAKVKLVFLDACRDNPLARSFRSASSGLAQMNAASGTLIAYATAPGQKAADGDGRNSPFTASLVRHMLTPGIEVGPMMKKVRGEVVEVTSSGQVPWVSESLLGDFYFIPPNRDFANVEPKALKAPSTTGAEPPAEMPQPIVTPIKRPVVAAVPSGTGVEGEPEMVKIEGGPGGTYWIGRYEVTQGEWRAVMGTNPSYNKGSDRLPVDQVSWNDAKEFCNKLSKKAGRRYTLPTGAQWEYACRAGTRTAFSFGDAATGIGDYAWFIDNSGNSTHEVGQLKPNAFGLYDMHGNVWEWCADRHGILQLSRELRGGAWFHIPSMCQSSHSYGHSPGDWFNGVGFRVSRTQ